MPHEFRNLPSASHETLTIALVGAGGTAFVLLLIIGYVVWRDRRLKSQTQHPCRVYTKSTKKAFAMSGAACKKENK